MKDTPHAISSHVEEDTWLGHRYRCFVLIKFTQVHEQEKIIGIFDGQMGGH